MIWDATTVGVLFIITACSAGLVWGFFTRTGRRWMGGWK